MHDCFHLANDAYYGFNSSPILRYGIELDSFEFTAIYTLRMLLYLRRTRR